MAWTSPLTWVVGQLVTAAQLNVHIRDNLQFLYDNRGVPGVVADFAGAAAPSGWLLCDGAAVSRSTYAALFAAIGTAWGVGDGSTTFNVPDLRGRVTVGVGTGAGLTARALAATGGEEAHALTAAENGLHTHVQNSHSHPNLDGSSSNFVRGGLAGSLNTQTIAGSNAMTSTMGQATATNQDSGAGTAHNTMPPFKALTKIIKT